MPNVAVIAYLRVSLMREEAISPQIQRAAIQSWAHANGRRVARTIEDLDQTGRHFRRRVTAAIEAIASGEAEQIAVYRFDRWGRNALESLANIRRVELAGGAVISVTEPFDAETAIGRYTRTNAFALAEMQSDIIGDNWKAAHMTRVHAGLPAAGKPRFGYLRLGRVPDEARPGAYHRDTSDPLGERYEADPATGPVLREVYERYAAGESAAALARWLDAQGIRTVRGGTWDHNALRKMMETGFAAGLLRVHDPACKCGRNADRCGRVLWLPGTQEPLIGMDLWEAFCARKRSRQRGRSGRQSAVSYPLSGLLFCGTCGHVLSSTFNYGTGGWGYRCNWKSLGRCATGAFVRRGTAEAAVLEWLAPYAARIEAAARGAAAPRAGRPVSRRPRLLAEETRIRGALSDLLVRRSLDQAMPDSAYDDARAKLLARLENAQARLAADAAQRKADAGDFRPIAVGLLAEWPTFSPARRREMLGTMIRRIEVHRTGLRKPPRIEIIPVWEPVG